jgi:hypothetical protein
VHLLVALLLLDPAPARARPNFVSRVPNASVNGCSTCHIDPRGGGERNRFGRDFDAFGRSWPPIAARDSDGDAFGNGVELGDPEGLWRVGSPNPLGYQSHPGDPNDVPVVGVADAGAPRSDAAAGRDAAPIPADAGAVSRDAGSEPPDSGAPLPDAGAVSRDAGSQSSDSGAPAADAGTQLEDAGRTPDTRSGARDAGVTPADSGELRADTGVLMGDAGLPDAGQTEGTRPPSPGEPAGGCGCQQGAGPAQLIGLTLILVALRRRRKHAGTRVG